MIEILTALFGDFTLAVVALGSSVLGLVAGCLGSFAVLRKQSLLGDSISHAALPGIILAFLLTGSKNSLFLILGAAVAGWIGTWFIMGIVRNTRIDSDGAQGIVLSVFFGIGLMLFSFVQNSNSSNKAGLDKIIFGQAATLLVQDIVIMVMFGSIALFIMLLFWKEFKLMTFDPDYGSSLGFSVRTVDVILTAMIVISIVIGLQTVGVILMSAMIIAPAAAARQWTDRLGPMVALAGFFGALAGVSGVLIESRIPNLATGPTIVLSLTAIVLFSLLFAPGRGLLSYLRRLLKNRYLFSLQLVLQDMFSLERGHTETGRFHDWQTISLMRERKGNIKFALRMLARQGFAESNSKGLYRLTETGRLEANRAQSSRLINGKTAGEVIP